MSNVTIRTATLEDLAVLFTFEQGVITAERPFDPTLKAEGITYYNMNELITADHIKLVIAEIDGIPVGSGYCRIETSYHYLKHPQHGYLGFMYVLPEHRGKGINPMLINHLIEWSKSKGLVELRLEVYDQNPGAIRAYEKTGFVRHMIEMRRDL